jgi:hypothetical protein
MKLLIQNNRIAGTATDAYSGPDFYIDAPADFDVTRLGEYQYIDDVLSIAPPPRHITKLAFRNRFTTAEKVSLEIASLDDPTAAMSARQQAAGLRVALKDQENASYIDLDRDDTLAGVEMLEAAGLIAAGRAAIVLDAPVTELERYRG